MEPQKTVIEHSLMDLIASKLSGIETVPAAEQRRMVSRTIVAAVEWHDARVVEEIEDFVKRVNA